MKYKYEDLTLEQQSKVDELEDTAFNNWADDCCEYNGFYECKLKSEDYDGMDVCSSWRCPRYEDFCDSVYYQDLIEEVVNERFA